MKLIKFRRRNMLKQYLFEYFSHEDNKKFNDGKISGLVATHWWLSWVRLAE